MFATVLGISARVMISVTYAQNFKTNLEWSYMLIS